MSYSSSSKDNILSFKGYIADKAGKFDDVGNSTDSVESLNDGFVKRMEMFKGSKWVYFCVNLHIDITTLRKYIPPGIKIELDFERNPDSFCLLSDKTVGNFTIELDDLRLKVERVIPGDSIMNYYRSSLDKRI